MSDLFDEPKRAEIDHRYTDTVICPYCGKDNGGDDGDGPPSGEQECINGECQKKFFCEPNVTVDYCTSKVPCWNGEPHRWEPAFYGTEDSKGIRSCRECRKSEWISRAAP